MNTISKIMMVAGCGAMMWSVSALASPLIGNWDSMGSPGEGNVSAFDNFSAVKAPSAFGIMDGSLGSGVLTLTLVGGGGQPTYGTVTTADSAFNGNYTTLGSGTTITFDLKPDTGSQVASGLSLYFTTPSDTWRYDFSQSGVNQLGQTQHFHVNMATFNPLLWYSDTLGNTATLTDFTTAQIAMSSIGIEIIGATSGTDIYKFDNFKIENQVPEPETVWMMIAVLASLAVTFRGRIKDVIGSIKA